MKYPLPLFAAILCTALLGACSGESTSAGPTTDAPDSISADEGAWSANDCAIIGPGSSGSAPADSLGESIVVTSTGPGGAPQVFIDEGVTEASSLGIIDVVSGSGDPVQPGEFLEVEYCGIGLLSRAVFDSSWARGQSASFPLDGLIAGWQEGLPGMQVGGRRVLVIPGALAYGQSPPPGIEPNETLVFVVDLVDRG